MSMIPKRKAKKLVDSFLEHFYGFGIDQDVREREAKECALIAVDEILNEFPQGYQGNFEEKRKQYWHKVKEEIMKQLLTISFVTFYLVTFCQDTAFFKTGDERSISYYYVQKSKDTLSWATISPQIPKGKSSYVYVIPKDTDSKYYRIRAIGKAIYSTRPILLVKVSGSVTITNALISTTAYLDNLSWNSGKEVNILHYLIEKSANSENYKVIGKVTARGYSKYTTSASKTGSKRLYKVTAVFKDGTKGTAIKFL